MDLHPEPPLIRLVFDFPTSPRERGSVRRVFSDPVDTVVARTVDEVRPALAEIERATRGGLDAAGYLAYEAAPAFDRAFRVREGNRMPLLWFGLFSPGSSNIGAPAPADLGAHALGPWRPEVSRDRYDGSVARIRAAIAEGRTYQVNYTTRLRAPFSGDPAGLYERLRRAQGSGYHALLELGEHAIVSVSPELFFHREGEDVTTRPMKGTRPRGRWPSEDEALERALRDSEKDQAENRMIVDLLRNDLGRVASIGSVRVPRQMEVERYGTVLQMTSTVEANVPEATGLTDLLGALFPCGSVTGAPKISTMGLIADLEDSPREVYCGAIGFIEGRSGRTTFSVPIRTVWIDRESGSAEYGAGGGITWDSTAAGEYDELVTKAAVLTRDWPEFDLLETMRLEGGRIARRARHLERLAEACRYFDRPCPEAKLRQVLDALEDSENPGIRRVRLLLSETGDVRTELAGIGEAPAAGSRSAGGLPEVVLASRPVDKNDPFLYHKTTNRIVYESHAAEHPWAFDVILYNDEGEATEMTRGNLVVVIEGRLVTPPRSAGLIAGCFRAELLERGVVTEARVPLDTLRRASKLWTVNSLRGWTEVRLAPGSTPRGVSVVGSARARVGVHA